MVKIFSRQQNKKIIARFSSFSLSYIKKLKKVIKGFTLPELMVVILIMGVLMAIATPMWLNAKARANAKACQSNLEIIRQAESEWALDHPEEAVPGYTIQSTDVDPYIDGGFASLNCEEGGTYSMPAIEADGTIPNPTCSYAATNPDHAIQ